MVLSPRAGVLVYHVPAVPHHIWHDPTGLWLLDEDDEAVTQCPDPDPTRLLINFLQLHQ